MAAAVPRLRASVFHIMVNTNRVAGPGNQRAARHQQVDAVLSAVQMPTTVGAGGVDYAAPPQMPAGRIVAGVQATAAPNSPWWLLPAEAVNGIPVQNWPVVMPDGTSRVLFWRILASNVQVGAARSRLHFHVVVEVIHSTQVLADAWALRATLRAAMDLPGVNVFVRAVRNQAQDTALYAAREGGDSLTLVSTFSADLPVVVRDALSDPGALPYRATSDRTETLELVPHPHDE